MTSGPTSPHLRELALDKTKRENFVKACKASIAAGGPVSEIIAAIRGTRWRFILTNCGQSIEVEHKDDLYTDYWTAVYMMKECRGIVGMDGYEHELPEAIRECERAHQRATQFMTRDENLGHLEHAIFDLFDDTGHPYRDKGITEVMPGEHCGNAPGQIPGK
jgi:hypothetical protein